MTFHSRHYTDLAKNEECTVQTAHCNRNPETTVTAHNPFGDRGTGTKCSDADSCWACSSCHDVIDARTHRNLYTPADRTAFFQRGKVRTQDQIFERGLVQVAGTAPRGTARKAKPAAVRAYVPPAKILPRVEYRR